MQKGSCLCRQSLNFQKEEVIAAALELVSEKGMSALTSRDLAARLGSSARPIFTVFKNMEEVQQAVQTAAMERFNQYAKKAMQYTPTFKQFGMQMILFAMQEPKLYQLLFMAGDGTVQNFDEIFCTAWRECSGMSDGVAEGLWAERGGSHGIVPACLDFHLWCGYTLCHWCVPFF